jgi:hypothetical protein
MLNNVEWIFVLDYHFDKLVAHFVLGKNPDAL